MRKLLFLFLLPLIALTGCGSITRAEYERANPDQPKLAEFEMPNGDQRVVYGAIDPRLDFAGNYTCPAGVRVVTYRGDVIVAKWFQEHARMKP